jgi:hypothetical protein
MPGIEHRFPGRPVLSTLVTALPTAMSVPEYVQIFGGIAPRIFILGFRRWMEVIFVFR